MKSYTLQSTKNPQLYRIVDRDGNWEHYAFVQQWGDDVEISKETARPVKEEVTFADLKEAVYLRGATTILGAGYAKDKFFFDWLSRHTPEERDAILNHASDRGDMVHRWIDMALTVLAEHQIAALDRDAEIYNRESKEERRLTNEEWDMVLCFAAFWNAHGVIPIVSEVPVYSLKQGYAGTTDALLKITKSCGGRFCPCRELVGRVGLWDWKTSGGIYPSYSAQTASYAASDNISEYLPNKEEKIAYTAVLRLGTKSKNGGYQIAASVGEQVAEDYKRFLAAKRIADYDYTPFDPETDVVDVPEMVSLWRGEEAKPAEPAPAEAPAQPTLDGSPAPVSKKPKKKPIKKSPKKKK